MMLKSVLLTLSIFASLLLTAQTYSVRGILSDEAENRPVSSATVRLVAQNDSTLLYNTVSDNQGSFSFNNLSARIYILYISSVGYDSSRQTVVIASSSRDLGKIALYSAAKTLAGVTVVGAAPPVRQKGDTLEYSASAFKVNRDALAEDIIKKMPGVTVDQTGAVTAQGEAVRKITIDGREFFGDDATAALRNLPAEVIDKVQVFDRVSDQSQFTGFDDGSSAKSINIVTKADMRNGQFGRVYAGYGTDERYSAGGNMSFFNGNRRISLVGLFNNINQQNFGSQDLLGVNSGGGNRGSGRGGSGGRARGGGGGGGNWGQSNNFLVGQQSGISKTTAAGINFSDLWAQKVEVTGSYFFNNSRNANNELSTQNFIGTLAGQRYNDTSLSTSNNYNHRLNMRIEYKIDSFNSLILTPNLSFQDNSSYSNLRSKLDSSSVLLSETFNTNQQSRAGYNLRNDLLFRHAFRKRGRTFSVNFNAGINRNSGDIYVTSLSTFYTKAQPVNNNIDQYKDQLTNGYSLGGSVSYTEPVGKTGQLELSYNPSYSYNKADQLTYEYDNVGKEYTVLNTNLSNKFDNTVTTQRSGLSYRKGNRDNMISLGLSYQYSELASMQIYPRQLEINKAFNNLLPSAMISRKFSTKSSIRIFYRSQTNAPAISQLQNVYDNSNPIQWRSGNPDLKQQFTNFLGTRYSFTDVAKGNSFFANIFVQKIDNYISNAIYTARADSFQADFPDTLRQGSQLTKPVNLDGYWSFRSFLTYGFPVKIIKSNINLSGGYIYSRLPGQIRGINTISNTNTFNFGAVVASNISEFIDFNISYSGNYNTVKNSAQADQNTTYFSHVAGVQANLLSKSGWFIQNDLNNQYYSGLSQGFNQNFWLWNAGIGKKFLKQQKAEIKLTVFDLLEQNQSVVRNITEAYIEDVQNQVIQQYFMLTFTYKLRNFGKKKESSSAVPGEGPGFNGPPSGGFQGRPPGGL
ncbi:MAG: outer membrane beta-barrel protein [Chitinophagaceae bacterium]|nr:outer membrane beta-barrel protein [Chitinophagaceae bacterium]